MSTCENGNRLYYKHMSLTYERVQSFNPKLVGKAVESVAAYETEQSEHLLSLGFGLAAKKYFDAVSQLDQSHVSTRSGEQILVSDLKEISRVVLGLAFLMQSPELKPKVFLLLQRIVHQLPVTIEANLEIHRVTLAAFIP